MDTKKLRQKILDLAIRGKLVPQDPNDEPASVLLERIRAEKEQLIKDGKIKRAKKSAASDKSHYENVPYKLPNGWCWCKLGDLCSFESGFAFSSNDFKTSGIPLVRISNIQDSTVTLKNCVFIQDEVDEKYIIKTGDLLIAMSGATTGKMGIYSMRQRALLNQRVGNICVQSRYLTANYRNYFMYSQSDVILKMAYGGAQPNISSQMILNIPIPLPPLSEQYRIVNAIKNLLEIVDRIEENQISLDKFLCSIKQKILQLALSGNLLTQDHNDEPAVDLLRRINPSYIPCDNRHYENLPTGWQLAKIKDVFTINPKNKVDDDIDAGFVSMAMIDDGYRDSYQFEKKKWTLIKNGFTHFKDGDIAVAKISPCLENRKSMILKNLPNGIGAGTTELHIFRSAIVDPKFALYFFKSDHFINQCVGTFNGVVGQQRVGKNIIEDIIFPLPPYKEQRRISEKITQIFMYLDKITAEL